MYEKEIDPVCGMAINPLEALAQTTLRGHTYYFCSQECKQKFDRQPEKYLDKTPQPESSR